MTFAVGASDRPAFDQALGEGVQVDILADLGDAERLEALRSAEALLLWNWARELRGPEEREAIGSVRFIQLISAGADHIPFDEVPNGAILASNVGAYAEPMAEHTLAMILSLAKKLPQNHAAMARGEWNQFALNRSVKGSKAVILGFGGIGKAVAQLLRPLGVEILAVNTSGATDEEVAFVGTLDHLDQVLAQADVIVVALPLTHATRGLIGREQLERMKADAILVNVARGAILDEAAFFDHLQRNPEFQAGIDAWWHEPLGAGEFRLDHPFFDLPNVLGSPHNSGLVPGILQTAAEKALQNVRRYLDGEDVRGVIDPADYA